MLRRALPLVLVGLVAAGCSGGDAPAPAATATSAPPPGTAEPSGSPTPSPTAALPSGCASLLPFTDLDRALGRPLFGETASVQGVPQPSIGRTGRLTCRYGLPRGGRGTAPVEVGVSTYVDAAAADRRVRATVEGLRGGGATQADATVGGLPATVLGTRTAVTLVAAQGSRTVAVTLQRSLRADRAVTAVAERVLANLDGG